MTERSNRATIIGVAVFLLGAITTFFLLQRDERGAETLEPDKATVLVAAKDIPASTTGADAVEHGLVRPRAVPLRSKPANAIADVSQLARTTAAVAIPAGRVLTTVEFPQSQTRLGTVRIPAGKTALAVQMANVAGVAGFAGAGDLVDVYAVTKQGGAAVRLVMQNIEVLSVNGTTLAPTQGQPGGAGLVFLLAVSPAQAERLVYLTTFESLNFSLVARGHNPVPNTPGATPADALKPT